MLTKFIENYLIKLGFRDIAWHYGNEGFYILCTSPSDNTCCYEIKNIVEEIIKKER